MINMCKTYVRKTIRLVNKIKEEINESFSMVMDRKIQYCQDGQFFPASYFVDIEKVYGEAKDPEWSIQY